MFILWMFSGQSSWKRKWIIDIHNIIIVRCGLCPAKYGTEECLDKSSQCVWWVRTRPSVHTRLMAPRERRQVTGL
jgi:hypothetical protein